MRNPWDWFVSQYFWNHAPDPISKKKLIREPVSTLREYWRNREERARLEGLDRFSPEDIRETYKILRRYRGVYQADSLLQYHYVYSPEGEQLVDVVGRFERIGSDFQMIAERIGIGATLPHRNSTSHRDFRVYYTEETASLVGSLYSMDTTEFGYSFDGLTL